MADAGAGEKLKVFISYSRKDSADFADELLAGLEVLALRPFSTDMTLRLASLGSRGSAA
jgi:hypothetical protein